MKKALIIGLIALPTLIVAQIQPPFPAYGSGGGSGTVTSVAASVPSILSISGSPITTSGTLAITLATETANTVLSGPGSGSAAVPTFRALVAADLPTITSLGTIATGVWNGTVITGQYGGTGVANTGSTITLAGNLVTSGANSLTFTTTGATNVTLPTTGTVATLAGSEAFTNKTGNISQWTNNSNYLTAITGGTCTNQAVTAVSTAGVPTCTTLTSAYTTGLATTAGTLAQFASTTSAQLATLLSDESGTGVSVFNIAPALTGPIVLTEAVGSSGLTITGATQTSSFPALNITQTWNNSGTTFIAEKTNITNTASAAASLLRDWQVGGTSMVSIGYDGTAGFLNFKDRGNANVITIFNSGSALYFTSGVNSTTNPPFGFDIGGSDIKLRAAARVTWTNGSSAAGGSQDLMLARPAAATLQMGQDLNGAAISQTLQAANGITGTNTTGGNFTLASGKGTGSGAVSSLIFQTPTATGSGTTAQALATRLTLTETLATLAIPLTITEAVGSSGLTITGATQTTSQPALNITQTWNASGTTFTGIKENITNTASAAGSLLMDLQVGGTSTIAVDKFGVLGFGAGTVNGSTFGTARIYVNNSNNGLSVAAGGGIILKSAVIITNTNLLGFNATSTDSSAVDLVLTRPAAGQLDIGSTGDCSTASRCRDIRLRHLVGGGTAPTVANTSANSCGTTTATIAGTDSAGKVTIGATSGTSCTITFGTAYTNAPACWANDETTQMVTKAITTTTTLIVSSTLFTAGDVVSFGCTGY